jgi:putative ABC transport system permease protein
MILRNLERQPGRTLVSIVGTAFAVSILVVGLAFIDVMDVLIDHQFSIAMRQDATVSFVEPRPGRTLFELAHLPGVMDVEPIRAVPVRLRAGHRSRTLAITGLPTTPRLNRVVDREGDLKSLPADGLVVSKMLARILDVTPGGSIQVEVLEGERPKKNVSVIDVVDDSMGLQAYMDIDAVHRLMREGSVASGAALTLDSAAVDRFYSHIKATPLVAAVSLRHVILRNFRDTMAQNMDLQIFLNVMFAGIIAFGVIYNSARVSLSERERELASLRVLGFTRAEISLILLGELAAVTVAALPLGALIGLGIGDLIMGVFNNEVSRLSFTVAPATIAWSFLIVIVAAIVSGLVVRRRLDRLDLVGVLKTRE